MNENVTQLLQNRMKYLQLAGSDLDRFEKQKIDYQREISELKDTISYIRNLSEHVEKDSVLKIGSRVYLKGKAKHTSEYMVNLPAGNTTYSKLCTATQTIKHLESKIEDLEELIEKLVYQKVQVERRAEQFLGSVVSECESSEISDLPKTVESDRGIAVKVGDVYEIIEYEEGDK